VQRQQPSVGRTTETNIRAPVHVALQTRGL
jgi:hypothetical protein